MLKFFMSTAFALTMFVVPARAEPPEGVVVKISKEQALVCDTKEQIAEIVEASISDGNKAAYDVLVSYYDTINDKGERTCVITPLNGRIALAESVFIGITEVSGKSWRNWATHFMSVNKEGKAFEYWMLWDEEITPHPVRWTI